MRSEQEHYLGSDGHITEALLVPEVLEGGDHVGLEVIPPKTELLIVSHGVLITMTLDTTLKYSHFSATINVCSMYVRRTCNTHYVHIYLT